MRSMRLKNREIKDQETLRELIDDCVVVRIGAMDKEGMFMFRSITDTNGRI